MNRPTNSLCLHSKPQPPVSCNSVISMHILLCPYATSDDCNRSSLFWNVTHHRLVVSYCCFKTMSVPSSRVKTAWLLKKGLIGCPRMSVHNFQSMLCKIPEEQGSRMHCVGSLKPCETASAYINCWWQSLSSRSLVLQCDHQLFRLCQAYIFIHICRSVYKC
jgi:hypothetical protein